MAASVQAHLHLDTDNPPTTVYTVLRRTPRPMVYLTLERGLDGTLHRHVLAAGATPKLYMNYVYQLKLARAELDTIMGVLGKNSYLIDNIHDPADHAPYSASVVLREINNISEQTVSAKATLNYFVATLVIEARTAS